MPCYKVVSVCEQTFTAYTMAPDAKTAEKETFPEAADFVDPVSECWVEIATLVDDDLCTTVEWKPDKREDFFHLP